MKLRLDQNRIAGELERVDEQLMTARFGRRHALEEERQNYVNESARVAKTLSDTEVEAVEALLPEGVVYADLGSLEMEVVFKSSTFDPSVAEALAAWAEYEAERGMPEEEEEEEEIVSVEPETVVPERPGAADTVEVTDELDRESLPKGEPWPEAGDPIQ